MPMDCSALSTVLYRLLSTLTTRCRTDDAVLKKKYKLQIKNYCIYAIINTVSVWYSIKTNNEWV